MRIRGYSLFYQSKLCFSGRWNSVSNVGIDASPPFRPSWFLRRFSFISVSIWSPLRKETSALAIHFSIEGYLQAIELLNLRQADIMLSGDPRLSISENMFRQSGCVLVVWRKDELVRAATRQLTALSIQRHIFRHSIEVSSTFLQSPTPISLRICGVPRFPFICVTFPSRALSETGWRDAWIAYGRSLSLHHAERVMGSV